MARLRKFVCYRRQERPYTRKSKFRKKSYVRANPNPKIVKFNIGNLKADFEYRVEIKSKEDLQIRDNALEAARISVNRFMERNVGRASYNLMVHVYPHHILREHALAAGAGADRFSSGMAHSFGKPTGIAAQVDAGQTIMSVQVNKQFLAQARKGIARAKHKVPCKCQVTVSKN